MRMFDRAFALTAVTTLALASAAGAQGVTYHSTSKFDMGGTMGAFMKMGAKMGGGDEATTTYLEGHRMATDSKASTSIIDVDAGRFTTVNKREKTYTTMTFEEMGQMLAQAEQMMGQARRDQTKEKAAPTDVKLDYTLSVDKSPDRQTMAGYDVQRQFITLTMTATAADPQAGPAQGNMVVLMDMWTTTEGPLPAAMKEFQRAYAAKARAEMSNPLRSMSAMFTTDPKTKAALLAAAKEMQKVQGVALKSTTYIVSVPQGQKFDRQLTLGAGKQEAAPDKGQKPKGGLFGKLKAAAAAAQAQPDENAGPAVQKTSITFGTEVQDVQTGVQPGIFSVPAGYKEEKLKGPKD